MRFPTSWNAATKGEHQEQAHSGCRQWQSQEGDKVVEKGRKWAPCLFQTFSLVSCCCCDMNKWAQGVHHCLSEKRKHEAPLACERSRKKVWKEWMASVWPGRTIHEAIDRDRWGWFASSKGSFHFASAWVKFVFVSTDGLLFSRLLSQAGWSIKESKFSEAICICRINAWSVCFPWVCIASHKSEERYSVGRCFSLLFIFFPAFLLNVNSCLTFIAGNNTENRHVWSVH